jgi:Ca-activated chloride channel family protein
MHLPRDHSSEFKSYSDPEHEEFLFEKYRKFLKLKKNLPYEETELENYEKNREKNRAKLLSVENNDNINFQKEGVIVEKKNDKSKEVDNKNDKNDKNDKNKSKVIDNKNKNDGKVDNKKTDNKKPDNKETDKKETGKNKK